MINYTLQLVEIKPLSALGICRFLSTDLVIFGVFIIKPFVFVTVKHQISLC